MSAYHRVARAQTIEEKTLRTIQLAECFAAEHDATDHTITDDCHAYTEAFEAAKMQYQQTAVKLGRLALHCIEFSIGIGKDPVEETPNQGSSIN